MTFTALLPRALAALAALVLLVSSSSSYSVHAQEVYNGTLAPTQRSIDDVRLHSYFCLEKQQKLCVGISTDGDPTYNPNFLYSLQVKRRDANEAKGTDYQKMRWTVDRTNGRIQLSNFTSLCAAKQQDVSTMPAMVALRPCGTTGRLERWNLQSFLKDITEQGTLMLDSWPGQCLTLMACNRGPLGNCDPNAGAAFPHNQIPDSENLRGAYLKMMPCVANSFSQSWRQTLDCAPGCSPFMTIDDTCDEECNTQLCNWDNNACATKKPTPPTPRPTWQPTKSPTTSKPSLSPTRSPTRAPTYKPTKSPTTSRPTKSPTSSRPSLAPTSSQPTKSPTSSQPTKAPTSSQPTSQPSRAPTFAPVTNQPTVAVGAVTGAKQEADFNESHWWVWLLVALGAIMLCMGGAYAVAKRRKNKQKKRELEEKDVESGGGGFGGGVGEPQRIVDLDEIEVVEKFPAGAGAATSSSSSSYRRVDIASPVDTGGKAGAAAGDDHLLLDSAVRKGSMSSGTAATVDDGPIPLVFPVEEGVTPPVAAAAAAAAPATPAEEGLALV